MLYVCEQRLYEYLRAQCLIKNFALMIYNEGVNGESSRASFESSSSEAFGFRTYVDAYLCRYIEEELHSTMADPYSPFRIPLAVRMVLLFCSSYTQALNIWKLFAIGLSHPRVTKYSHGMTMKYWLSFILVFIARYLKYCIHFYNICP